MPCDVSQGFDTETVWEQLQLRNPSVQKFVAKVTKRLLGKGDDLQVRECVLLASQRISLSVLSYTDPYAMVAGDRGR